ncbi:MAG: acyl-CoA dehydrogenase family protein [Nitrososphaerales archaeon]
MVGFWTEVDSFDEERIFRESIRAFVEEFINPLEDRAKRGEYEEVCRLIRRESAKRGILGACLPLEVGGQGAKAVFHGIGNEELGRGRVFGYGVVGILHERYAIFARSANPELVKKWMPRILNGEAIFGIGSTEPRTGSDVATMVTTATKKGDKYVINGEKGPISSIDRDDGWLLLARTGSPGSGAKGITQFFVEKDLAGIEKYHFNTMESSANLGGIRLTNVEVPEDHVVGELNQGFIIQMKSFELERALIPFNVIGAAAESLEAAVGYTKSRVVWGKPIATFEGVMFPIVESVTKLDVVRVFAYHVLRLAESGKNISTEASMLRWYVARTALDSLDSCIQVSGAAGYTDIFPHERRYRWVRAHLLGHGSQEIQKLVTARAVFGRQIYDLAMGRVQSKTPSSSEAASHKSGL